MVSIYTSGRRLSSGADLRDVRIPYAPWRDLAAIVRQFPIYFAVLVPVEELLGEIER
jgi:hypothetical protein